MKGKGKSWYQEERLEEPCGVGGEDSNLLLLEETTASLVEVRWAAASWGFCHAQCSTPGVTR